MAKVLIVEDDESLVAALREQLLTENYVVESTGEGHIAYDLLSLYEYDIVILDLGLPDVSGVDVLRRYRQKGGQARVLILTGRDRIEEKEAGFNAGADDYLTKPFHIRELMSRVRALMRRTTAVSGDELQLGALILSPRNFNATLNGAKIHLTPKEFALLEFLIRHKGEVFKSDALLDSIWASDSEASTATVKSYVHRLRDKLGKGPDIPQITTLHGAGYKVELL